MMNRKQKLNLVVLMMIGSLTVASVFQNCAKVSYKTQVNPPTTTTNSVSKTVTIDPSFNSQNADLKVLLVVDDSYTMSQSQTRLSNAVDSLLGSLSNRNVEFKIVSTSGIPDNEIDYVISPRYLNEGGTEVQASQISNLSTYFVEKKVTPSVGVRHQAFKALKGMNTSQFNALKTQIKNSILAVGTNGSDTEEGFCAAARQLFDTSANRFFKAGDKAAIIFLTDENDSSVFSKCLSRYKERVSNKPVVYYNYQQQRAQLTLEYQAVHDGLTTWVPTVWGVPLSGDRTISIGTTCSSADMTAAVQKINSMGYNVRNVSQCIYDAVAATYFGADLGDDGSIPSKNLCSSPVVAYGQNFPNFYSYINSENLSAAAGSCTKETKPANAIVMTTDKDYVIKSDVAASNAEDLKAALINKTSELFGTGFIVASIIRKNNESCALQTGQSYGTKYEQLTSQLGENGTVETMCASNFTNVLTKVSQFIANVANNSYVVPDFKEEDQITGLAVKRNGATLKLTNAQYEAVHGTITLTNFPLQPGDLLLVDISTIESVKK